MSTDYFLQTSPYVVIKPDDNSRDKNFFSTLKGEYHKVNDLNLKILEFCKYPRKAKELFYEFGSEVIGQLVTDKLLSDPATIWEETNIVYMEIETTTICNWKCQYCHYTFDPKPPKVMAMSVFNEIIDKAARHPSLKTLAFNAFNEPTLDVHFEERVKKLAQTDIKLLLYTNGSNLDEAKIRLLKETEVIDNIKFNLPSIDEKEFCRLTGWKLFDRTMLNIENTIREGFKVEIIVNGDSEEVSRNLSQIQDKFKHNKNVSIVRYITMDRAGLLKNKYNMNYYHKDELCGCMQIIKELRVGVNGDFFICTMDYYQKNVFGNIRDGEIADIMKSEKAQLIRKQVFGAEIAPENYICRRCWATMLARMDSRYSKSIKPVLG